MFKNQINIAIIKAVVAIAALMISFLFLGSYTCSPKKHLKSIGLSFSYPLSFYKEEDETKIYNFNDTILIFYYSDFILYRLSPTIKFETGEKLRGTEPYFIYHKNNEFGFLFTSLTDSSRGTKCLVDSFLANRGMRGKDFDIPVDSLWTLTEAIKKKGTFLEKYGSLQQGDETTIDSIYYYYSKDMNKIEYSFSKKLDSIKAMKLFKVRFLYNERTSTSNKIIFPKRELSFEMIELEAPNPQKIMEFLKKFESASIKEQ